YGMMPIYTETLGGTFYLTKDFEKIHRPVWPLQTEPPVDGAAELKKDPGAEDFAKADVLMMMYPNSAWTGEQLKRIHAFVRRGGSLLVFGEHTIRQADGRSRFNDVLELFAADSDTVPQPLVRMADLVWSWEQREKHLKDLRNGLSPAEAAGDLTAKGKARAAEILAELSEQFGDAGLSVDDLGRPEKEGRLQNLAARVHRRWAQTAPLQIPFASALFEVGGWLDSYDALAHPATSGLRDDRNQFGAVIGAPVTVRAPARPVLVGRFGWAEPGDPGSAEAMMRDRRLTPGEPLGDIILAAEQTAGKGRVVAFGDTSTITNGINVGAHAFTSRLLTYLADPGSVGNPQVPWRQTLGLLAAAVLIAGLAWRGHPWRTAAASGLLAASIALCTGASYQSALTLPDGSKHAVAGEPVNNLAYIDASHLELAGSEGWGEEGTMGLCLTLMRNGPRERKALRDYVNNGGIFILTVGYPESGPSRGVLEDFGFSLDAEPDGKAPQTMGCFKAPYVQNGSYMAYVRFHAAWPVRSTLAKALPSKETPTPEWAPIAYGPGDKPVILMRRMGKGKVVVVGDTCFAMNKNLEREDGLPIEGLRENADFWRWLLPTLTDREAWLPSPPAAPPAAPPVETDQPAAEPAATEPAETEPATMEPAATEPAETEPAATEPAETEPAATEPAASQPADAAPEGPQ
ncbi:MAG: hypothetical protein NTV86_16900, partial [Planctomycetota bacterium]|nr:hypothetical protein [Planctomycetota bacterium]